MRVAQHRPTESPVCGRKCPVAINNRHFRPASAACQRSLPHFKPPSVTPTALQAGSEAYVSDQTSQIHQVESHATTSSSVLPVGVSVAHISQQPSDELPFLLYLPDIDGAGVTSNRQWEVKISNLWLKTLTGVGTPRPSASVWFRCNTGSRPP